MDSPVKSVTRVPEAEQAVVGITLAVPGAIAITRDLALADFAEPEYSAIWSAIVELDSAGQPVDLAAVAGRLGIQGGADVAGSPAHLEELALGVPTTNLEILPAYVKCVRDAALRRAAIAEAQALQRLVLQPGDLDDALDRHEQRLEALRGKTKAAAPLFSVVPIDDLAHVQPPAPDLWWGEWVPARVVTLFSAHGGTGKSNVALMLAASIAAGSPLFGIPTRHGRVAFYSAEDPAEIVRYRLAQILRGLDIAMDDIADRLHIIDATEGDPTLFREVTASGTKAGCTTRAYEELRRYVADNQIDVLIVDNASDAFDANEIDRARVRGFMRSLARIAMERNGAVLLLAHVDKSTSRGDKGPNSESYSGSTAWHNSARSRMFMSRDKEGILTLEHQKNNLTRKANPISLMWPDGGIPQLEYVPNGMVLGIRDRGDAKPLLKLIHEFSARGEFVSTAEVGPATAHAKLSGEPGFPKHLRKPADTMAAIRDAQRRGLLIREWHRTKDRKDKEHWSLTPDGLALIGASAPVAPIAPIHGTSATGAAAEPAAPIAPVLAHRGCGGELERTTGAAGSAA